MTSEGHIPQTTNGFCRPLAISLTALTLTFGAFGCAGQSESPSLENPKNDDEPVALITGVPEPWTEISKAKFDMAFLQAWKRSRLAAAPKKGDVQFERVKEKAMDDLLDQAWLTGQASELGITASNRQVQTDFDSIRRTQFPKEGAYEKFLKQSGFTNQQVLERVKLQVLSRKIEERLRDEGKDLRKYVRGYNRRWRARTTCAPSYLVDRCRNDEAKTQTQE